MRKAVAWAVALVLGLAPRLTAADWGARLGPLLAEKLTSVKAPGAVMLVSTPAGRWVGATGLADVARRRPMQVGDGFRISSGSKVLVATTVLKLCEEGRLALDEKAATYLPAGTMDGIANGTRVTIRQLLGMVTGIPDYDMLRPFRRAVDQKLHPAPRQPAEILKFVAGLPAEFEPGENQSYANINYIILEMVVNAVTGHTLAAEIRRVVIDPLGLKDTYTEIAEPRDGGFHGLLVRGYEDDKDCTELNESLGLADCGIISTAADLEKLLDGLLRRKVLLSPAMLAEMNRFNPIDNYGLGLDRGASPWGAIIGHSGLGAGYATNMRYLPNVDTTIIVLCNDVDSQLFNEIFEAALTIALPDTPAAPNGGYRVVQEWGWEGDDEEEFEGPAGIAFDAATNMYIADYFNHRIQKISADDKLVKVWGHHGAGPGQFNQPAGVALNARGQVFVADYQNHRIQVFNSTGAFLNQWPVTGPSFAGEALSGRPAALALDGTGLVFVADDVNHRVQVYTEAGAFVRQWGGQGVETGQFQSPRGIAADGQGNVYVADQGNGRVQKFTAEGSFEAAWKPDDAFWQDPPYLEGLAVDNERNLWVADGGRCCLYRVSPDFRPLALWRGWDAGVHCFGHPQAVAIDAAGAVYVGDAVSNCVVKAVPAAH